MQVKIPEICAFTIFVFAEELFYTIAKDYKDDPAMHKPEPSMFIK